MKGFISLDEYLQQSGVLELGDADAIRAAKKEYRREYMKRYKRERRTRIHEVVLSIDPRHYTFLKKQAEKHGLTMPGFLLHIIESYCQKIPVTQHPQYFAALEVAVAQLHSEMVFMADQLIHNERSIDFEKLKEGIWDVEQKIQSISNTSGLEDLLRKLLREDIDGTVKAIISEVYNDMK